MIREYIEAAMTTAQFEPVEDCGPGSPAQVYGRVSACPGVWATGQDHDQCWRALEEVLEGWILLATRFGDALPEIQGKRIGTPDTLPRSIY